MWVYTIPGYISVKTTIVLANDTVLVEEASCRKSRAQRFTESFWLDKHLLNFLSQISWGEIFSTKKNLRLTTKLVFHNPTIINKPELYSEGLSGKISSLKNTIEIMSLIKHKSRCIYPIWLLRIIRIWWLNYNFLGFKKKTTIFFLLLRD